MRNLLVGVALALVMAVAPGTTFAADVPVPGRLVIVKPGRLLQFIARTRAPHVGAFIPLPAENPTVVGATLRVYDTGGVAGFFDFALPAANWKGLGNPAGAKGWRYRGAGTPADPCTAVIIQPRQIRATCRGAGITFTPPFQANLGLALSVGGAGGTRYCADFGGTPLRNSSAEFKRRQAPTPLACACPGGPPTARARVIGSNANDLVGGPMARGRAGDILLVNDKIKAIVQQPGRVMFGIGTYGGNIVDADLQRCLEPGRDQFEELTSLINLENTANYTNVSVINDGANGFPAIVRATGPDDLLDFINASSTVASFGFAFPAAADDRDLPVDVQTDYILEAGKPYVRMETTVTNLGAAPLDIYMGDIANGSGKVESFQAVYGFGEPLVTDPPCPVSTYQPCTAGTCDLCNIVAWSGERSGRGVSYGYIHTTNGSTSFNTSGVAVPILGRQVVLVLIGALPPNFHLNPASTPGDSFTVTRYFAVGDGSVAAITSIRNDILGVSNTGTLQGTVLAGGLPVDDADVVVLGTPVPTGPQLNVVTHFRTAADGTFSGTLPAGSYSVRANKDGSLFGVPNPAPVTIVAGNTTVQNFALGASGTLTVTVEDENGDPIPAKVQLVGLDPSPDPLNRQSVFGLISNTTGVFGAETGDHDGLPYGIALVEFAGVNGTTGAFAVEPGSYELSVSHGTRYSVFRQPITIVGGSNPPVNAQLARVIDTPNFVAADFHVHSLASPDAEVTDEERVITQIAEGMDFFTPSDHDFRTDFGPAIAAVGAFNHVATTTSAEITTFDYGHFNSWPVTIDPSQVNGGGVDFGRAGVAPGMDFPSLGSYSLTPAEIFSTAKLDPRPNLVQINHIGSFFNDGGLDIDTAELNVGPPTSHTPPLTRRLNPAAGNLFDDGFDALEVWIGTDGRNGAQQAFIGENLGDWFNMINQNILSTGVANSDTHQRRETQINARSYVASTVTDPALLHFAAAADNLAASVVAGKVVGSNGPFVQITANAASTGQTAGLGPSDNTLLATTDGNVSLQVTVNSPLWAEFDRIQFYVNNAPQRYDHDADAGTRGRYRVIPNFEHVAGVDFTVSTVNDVPSIPGAQHLTATTTLNLTGLTDDTWVVVLVRGTDGVSRPLFPVDPSSMLPRACSNNPCRACTTNANCQSGGLCNVSNQTPAELSDGNLNQCGSLAVAFTNPLYIDVDGGAWTPPGVILTP
jgi:hypothetical protein